MVSINLIVNKREHDLVQYMYPSSWMQFTGSFYGCCEKNACLKLECRFTVGTASDFLVKPSFGRRVDARIKPWAKALPG